MLTYMSWSNATILYSPPLRRNRACSHASQTQLRPSPDRQESSRFCPRVFGPNRHFPQESALYGPQIRAPDWTYAGPGELPDAGNICATCLPCLDAPRSAGKELALPASQTPFSRQESSRFCPRSLGQNRHFPQESALYGPKIRALLWAYVRPERAPGCRQVTRNIYALERSDYPLFQANLLKCRQPSSHCTYTRAAIYSL